MVDKLLMVNKSHPEHFVYQRIHTLAGKSLHLDAHLDLAARAFQHIYGGPRPEFDEASIAKQITELLRTNRSPAKRSATVILRFATHDNNDTSQSTSLRGAAGDEAIRVTLAYERLLLDVGYSLSPMRPKAVSYEYDIPFGGFPTGLQLSAAALFDTLALSHHGATRSVRRDGDRLLSCGDAPLFGIRGKTLFTAPLTEGAVDSIERRMIIAAVTNNHEKMQKPLRLDFLEEAVPHSELTDFDELFFADAAGITSLSECDGAKFMSLLAPRLVAAMK